MNFIVHTAPSKIIFDNIMDQMFDGRKLTDFAKSLQIDQCKDSDFVVQFLGIIGHRIHCYAAWFIMLDCYYNNNLKVAKFLCKKYVLWGCDSIAYSSLKSFEYDICPSCSPIALQQFVDEFKLSNRLFWRWGAFFGCM
jgi:hypothetical protein